MRHYFLGVAANYSRKKRLIHTFAVGRKRDCEKLEKFLTKKYRGERTILTKNGRSALTLALKANFKPGDAIILNGFTCYAVYEAIKAANLVPIWADIDKVTLNFNAKTVDRAIKLTGTTNKPVGIIVQNSLGNMVDALEIEELAKKHNLTIIEDLAHCAGLRYPDGREAGTVGAAAIFSFGKDKAIDTISGGAVVLRHPCKNIIKAPSKLPKVSDILRARFYPLFGAISRGLSYICLGGVWMRILVKIHWVEKSADNKLNVDQRIAKFEAKLALKQIKNIDKSKIKPLRKFYLVNDRDKVLKNLQKKGYYFGGFWYERPVSPERYYKKVHFPETDCPISTEVTKKIINLPSYYKEKDLKMAKKIIANYLEEVK